MDETILSSNLQLPRPFPVYAINAPKEVIVSDKAGDIIIGLLYICISVCSQAICYNL